jgi:hypothetical protein
MHASLRVLIVLAVCACASTAERLTWSFGVPEDPLRVVRDDPSRFYEEDRAPHYVLHRYVVRGRSAEDWEEAFEVINFQRRELPATPALWYEEFRARGNVTCPSEWRVLEEAAESVTFERRSSACAPHAPQTALYRVLYGRKNVFLMIATTVGEFEPGSRETWLGMLASGRVASN